MSFFCLPFTSLVLVTLCILLSLYSLNVEQILLDEKLEKERFAFLLKSRMKRPSTFLRRNSSSSSGAFLRNYSPTSFPKENAVLRGNDLRSRKNGSNLRHGLEKSRSDINNSSRVNMDDNHSRHWRRKKKKAKEGQRFSYHPMCDFTALFSCTPVFTSPYSSLAQFIKIPFTSSYLPAVPNSAFAFLFYLVELGCCFYTATFYWLTIVGVGVTVAIASLLALKVHEVCPVLVSLYALNILSFVVARQRRQHCLRREDSELDEEGKERALYSRSTSCPSSRKNGKEKTNKKGTENVQGEDYGGKIASEVFGERKEKIGEEKNLKK